MTPVSALLHSLPEEHKWRVVSRLQPELQDRVVRHLARTRHWSSKDRQNLAKDTLETVWFQMDAPRVPGDPIGAWSELAASDPTLASRICSQFCIDDTR